MRYNSELDANDLVDAVRRASVLPSNDIINSSERIVSGGTYHAVEAGFVLNIQRLRVLRPYRFRMIRRNYVTFQFTQTGAYRLSSDGQIRQVRSGTVRLNAMPDTDTDFAPSTTVRGASIFIEREQLIEQFGLRPDGWREEYRTAFSKASLSSLSLEMPLSREMWAIIDALQDCNFDEPLRGIYLTAKATELLTLAVVQLNSIAKSGSAAGLGRAAREQRLIEAAAQIYQQDLSQPPSIGTLSRRIGLNRNKLTEGFRLAFGMTPAEYSRQVRLDWASRKLSQGLDVNVVALEVGYDSTAAFSRAFRDRYGHGPSRQKRQG